MSIVRVLSGRTFSISLSVKRRYSSSSVS